LFSWKTVDITGVAFSKIVEQMRSLSAKVETEIEQERDRLVIEVREWLMQGMVSKRGHLDLGAVALISLTYKTRETA
jgi:hypothetical protein